MAFQVTPETDVAEAAMFHGAAITLGEVDPISTSNVQAAYVATLYDTDGFVSSNQLQVPEGVNFVKVGYQGFLDTLHSGTDDRITLQIFLNSSLGNATVARAERYVATAVVADRNDIDIQTGRPIAVIPGDYFTFLLRAQTSSATKVFAHGTFTPHVAWIEAIKTPFGRPDSPTLP